MEENIKTTGSILGILTFIAYLNQYFYYWYYDIDISNYIGIDEVFTPFLDDLASNITLMLFCVAVVHIIRYLKEKDKSEEEVQTLRIQNKDGYVPNWLVVPVLLVFSFSLAFLLFFHDHNYLLGVMFLGVMGIYCIHLFIIINTDIPKNNYEKYPMTVILSLLMSFMLVVNLLFTILHISNNENRQTSIRYRFILNDKVEILTDKDNVYLGRTKKVFFIDRKKYNKISVYNTADITYEEIL
jgi:hypothetical protein